MSEIWKGPTSVIIDNNGLNFHRQIAATIKSNKIIGIIQKHLEHGCILWDPITQVTWDQSKRFNGRQLN